MDREEIASQIARMKVELDDLHKQFNMANSNSELEDGDRKVWNAVVKASDALCDAQEFVDKHYYGA